MPVRRAAAASPQPPAAASVETLAVPSQRGSVPPAAPSNRRPVATTFAAKIERKEAEGDEQPLLRRLRPALIVLGVAIAIAIFDPIYAALTKEQLEVIGVRLSLFGGALLLLALALAGREVFRDT